MRAALLHRSARPIPFASITWPSGVALYSDRPFGLSGVGAFAPRVLEMPAFTFATGLRPGSVAFPETSILLEDVDGEIRDIVEGGEDVAGSRCAIGWGAPGVAYADWHVALDGVIAKPEYEGDAVRVPVHAQDAPMRGTMPKAQILAAEAPLALDSSFGTYLPLLWGEHDALALTGRGMVPCPNWSHGGAGVCRYALCLGWAKAVTRVYLNGAVQVEGGGSDYTVSHPIIGGKLITSIDFVGATAADAIVTADAIGYERVGDGSGEAILNPVEQLLHMLVQFGFADWRFGTWNDPADYAVDLADMAAASSHATTLSMEGGMRLGGTSEAEQILDVVQRWLGSNPPFRSRWTEGGKFSVLPLSHIFGGYTSTGPAVPSSQEALFIRGRVHEIGDTFRPKTERSVIRRVDMAYLYGAQDGKFWSNLSVMDVSQAQQVVEALQLFTSAPHVI
jgi:hypothetical protein